MAKQKTLCERCDGTFDGTPSGWKKHEQTTKHNLAKTVPGDGLPDSLRASLGLEQDIEAAPDEPTTDPETGKEAVLRGFADILNGTATGASVIADLKDAGHLPDEGSEVFPPEPVKPTKPRKYALSEDDLPEPEPEYVVVPFDREELDERPDSSLFGEFRPYEYPPRMPLIQKLAADATADRDAALVNVGKFKRYVRHGELHALKLLPKYQAQLKAAQDRVAMLDAVIEGIDDHDQARYNAHIERAQLWWQYIHGQVLVLSGAFSDGKLVLEGTGMTVEFGPFVKVNGPRLRYGEDATEREIVPATVSLFDTFQSVHPNVAIGVALQLQQAGRYAEELNRLIQV